MCQTIFWPGAVTSWSQRAEGQSLCKVAVTVVYMLTNHTSVLIDFLPSRHQLFLDYLDGNLHSQQLVAFVCLCFDARFWCFQGYFDLLDLNVCCQKASHSQVTCLKIKLKKKTNKHKWKLCRFGSKFSNCTDSNMSTPITADRTY